MVVPFADAGLRLPREGGDLRAQAAFHIGDDRLEQIAWNILDIHDAVDLPAVSSEAAVVEVGADVEAAPSAGQHRIVEIEHVRIVLIHQIARAVVEVLHIPHIGQSVAWVLRTVEPLLRRALFVQVACVPVAVFGHALAAPMVPDGKFSVAIPLGAVVPKQ